jgi:hypothetical protein
VAPAHVPPPRATATIEPSGPGVGSAREHTIHLILDLGTENAAQVSGTAEIALAVFAAHEKTNDPAETRQLLDRKQATTGIEGTLVCPSRPSAAAVTSMCASLTGAGYRVVVRERRECGEPGCHTDCLTDWDQPDVLPSGWFANAICGRHDYRRCRKCPSVYRMTSTNAAGQQSSLHCEVCGAVLIEWGGSKIWDAQRVQTS